MNAIKKIKFYTLIISLLFVFGNEMYSQGPGAPEAASFEPVDATDMVNLLTGDMSYVVPLINVPGPDGGYPVSLSYHGAVSMEQQSSWVGLGWSLNPGAINRSVNGYPDDWDVGNIVEYFYDTSEETINTLSIGYGVDGASIGTSLSWGSNRSLGGSIYAQGGGFGISLGTDGASINGSVGAISGSIGTNGWSVGVNAKTPGSSVGLNYSNNFQGESSFGSTFSVANKKGNALQFGLSSNGVSLQYSEDVTFSNTDSAGNSNETTSSVGIGLNVQFHQTLNQGDFDISRSGWKIPLIIPTPAGTFTVSYGQQKIKYTLNEESNEIINGVLYSSLFENPSERLEIRGVNIYGPSVGYGDWFIIDNINELPPLGNYDHYESRLEENQEKLMDIYEVDLYNNEFGAPQLTENNPTFPAYDSYDVNSQGMSGSMSPRILENGALKGLDIGVDDEQGYSLSYQTPPSSHSSHNFTPFDSDIHFYFNNDNSTSLIVDYLEFFENTSANDIFDYLSNSNENQSLPRKKGGRFVEKFTNQEIATGEAYLNGFLKADPLLNYDNPDDFDPNGIGGFKITSIDGKTYHYSLAVYNHELINRRFGTIESTRPESESYFEKRQLKKYATHWLLTAVTGPDYLDMNNNNFPDEADYGYWIDFNYGKWSSAYAWKTPYGEDYSEEFLDVVDPTTGGNKSVKYYTWGRKDIYYLDAIKSRTHTALFIKGVKEDNVGEEIMHNARRPDGIQYTINIPSQQLMRLNSIHLIPNDKLENANLFDKQNDFNIIEDVNREITLNWQGKTVVAEQNLIDNVLDIGDFDSGDLQSLSNSSIKSIDLSSHYSYDLVKNSPNSIADTGGRLTLNGLTYLGKSNTQYLPSYYFEYENEHNFDLDQRGNWGFHKENPTNWTLNEIATPQGAKVKIEQESDIFHQTSVLNNGNSFDLESVTRYITPGNPSLHNKLNVGFFIGDRIGVEVGDEVLISYLGECFEATSVGDSDPDNGEESEPINTWNYNGIATITSIANGTANAISINPAHCLGENCPPSDADITCSGFEIEKAFVRNPEGKFYERKGGGLRVKSIIVTDNSSYYKTNYNYNKDITYSIGGDTNTERVSSGIVSYVPHEEELFKLIPYASELPPPVVMYEYVETNTSDLDDNPISGSSVYQFEVLHPDNFLDIVNVSSNMGFSGTFSNPSENATIDIKNHLIIDYMAAIGRIISIENFNIDNQLLSRTTNRYKAFNEIDQGIIQESFQTYKIIDFDEFTDINGNQSDINDRWIINSSTRKIYPNVLESSTISSAGQTSTTFFENHDEYTGKPLITKTFSSDGSAFKIRTVPAYTIPEYSGGTEGFGMGSKVDNITNKNMLSQEAANFSYLIDETGQEKILSANINTWNNNWEYTSYQGATNEPTSLNEKVWRKKANYIWKGNLNEDGTYNDYIGDFDNFDWNLGTTEQEEQWQRISETTLYDHYSMPLESMDINDNYASTKMFDDESKIASVSNAAYGEQFYTGAEYDNMPNIYIDQQIRGKASRTSEKAHTGNYSLKINPSSDPVGVLLKKDKHRPGLYKMSVWVYKDNHQNARFRIGSTGTLIPFSGEKVFAGKWVQLNHYFERTEAQVSAGDRLILIASNSGDIYADDLRVHPVQSSMSSYVYNEWDELTHIIGANNLATRYEYDEVGRLKYTFVEVADTPTVEGGFKLAAEYNQNYKREISNDCDSCDSDDEPPAPSLQVTLGNESSVTGSPPNCDGLFTSGASVSGGSGNYSYTWSKILNGQEMPLPGFSGANASYSYDPLAAGCGGIIRFKCHIVDNEIEGLSIMAVSPERSLNCSCDQQ